jgi:hypothetical protein
LSYVEKNHTTVALGIYVTLTVSVVEQIPKEVVHKEKSGRIPSTWNSPLSLQLIMLRALQRVPKYKEVGKRALTFAGTSYSLSFVADIHYLIWEKSGTSKTN